MSKPIKSAAPQGPQTVANDNCVAEVAEIVRNGESINWDYWASRHSFSPEEAAKLAHCIDPIRWPDETHAQGVWSDDLSVKVRALTAWLAERRTAWTLAELVHALGDSFAPHTMKVAIGPMGFAALAGTEARLSEKKRQEGRYTLEEAAQLLAAETSESADRMQKKFMAAAKGGELPVYAPGNNARYLYGPGHAQCVRVFYEEAYWSDLNAWLAENEPRLDWKFPNPHHQATHPPSESLVESESLKNHGSAPLQRQRFQEQEIIRTLTKLGHDPLAIPKWKAGERGVKSKIREALKTHKWTEKIFNKAWQRLRDRGEIAEDLGSAPIWDKGGVLRDIPKG